MSQLRDVGFHEVRNLGRIWHCVGDAVAALRIDERLGPGLGLDVQERGARQDDLWGYTNVWAVNLVRCL